MSIDVDYGPLLGMIGVWDGDKGVDVSPEPDGEERNPYYETITFSGCGDVTNAETQKLAVVHYRQIVRRKSNDEVFHDETGYWLWDSKTRTVVHSLTIPRGVCVLAGGIYNGETNSDGQVVLEVTAGVLNDDWKIIQSPFMLEKARTTEFSQKLLIGKGRLSYAETITVDIYGKTFEHTDQNELILVEP